MEIHKMLYLKPLQFKETLFVSMKHCYTDESYQGYIGSINILTQNDAEKPNCTFGTSRLDYCNSLLT